MQHALPSDLPAHLNAVLLLEDGRYFLGQGVGARDTVFGEICFTTGMTGYQETLTDLSFAGQIVTFTFPHIGNVGANEEDIESKTPACRGLVLREPISDPSNFRSYQHFNEWLTDNEVTGICGVDTRALTRHIRKEGAQNAAICFRAEGKSFDLNALQHQLTNQNTMEGQDLAVSVTTQSQYHWQDRRWKLGIGYTKYESPTEQGEARSGGQRSVGGVPPQKQPHVVAIDYGAKLNILRSLVEAGCKVSVVNAKTSAEEILKMKPDGIFLSNGPGDPAATGEYAVPILQKLIASGKPIFGICLGHQLLGIALGGKTEKLHQGHRGANHPVQDLQTGKVEITSQNHGFAVIHDSLPENVKVTHRSLFDGTVEGLRVQGEPIFSVQYHPESSPGPHDSQHLFARFIEMMRRNES